MSDSNKQSANATTSQKEVDRALAQVRWCCSDFQPESVLHHSPSTVVFAGHCRGEPAAAKVLLISAPQWIQQLAREIAIYRLFAIDPPPVKTPRFIDGDEGRGVLILNRIDGEPVATERHPRQLRDRESLARIFTETRRLAPWHPSTPVPAHWRVNYQTRLDRARRQESLTDSDYQALATLLLQAHAYAEHAGWAFSHGDLELRNVLRTSGGFVFLDWEFAGWCLPGFDLALLWVILGRMHGPRRVIEDLINELGAQRSLKSVGDAAGIRASFLVNLALLVIREQRMFHSRRPSETKSTILTSLAQDWAHIQKLIHHPANIPMGHQVRKEHGG